MVELEFGQIRPSSYTEPKKGGPTLTKDLSISILTKTSLVDLVKGFSNLTYSNPNTLMRKCLTRDLLGMMVKTKAQRCNGTS